MLFAELRPVAPAHTPGGSITAWVLLAVILAIVVASGLILSSRR